MVPWERETRIDRDGVSLSGPFQTSLPETDPQAVTAAGAAFSEVSRDSLLGLGADLASQSAECQAHSELPEVGRCCLQLSIECLWVGYGPCSTLCCLPRTGWNILGLCTLVPSGVRGEGQDSFVLATLCLWAKVEPPRASVLSREPDAEGASCRPPRRTQSVLQQAQSSASGSAGQRDPAPTQAGGVGGAQADSLCPGSSTRMGSRRRATRSS